jgi:Protein of unknown function (DUF3703)
MSRFSENIGPAVDGELDLAASLMSTDPAAAFAHLERAHVLGQRATKHHVRCHLAMLRWAAHQRSTREASGQLLRLVGALTKTAIGLVPDGNTGGSNISPFRRLPIPDDLAKVIATASTA